MIYARQRFAIQLIARENRLARVHVTRTLRDPLQCSRSAKKCLELVENRGTVIAVISVLGIEITRGINYISLAPKMTCPAYIFFFFLSSQ